MVSDHDGIKLKISNYEIDSHLNIYKLNKTLKNNSPVKDDTTRKRLKYILNYLKIKQYIC